MYFALSELIHLQSSIRQRAKKIPGSNDEQVEAKQLLYNVSHYVDQMIDVKFGDAFGPVESESPCNQLNPTSHSTATCSRIRGHMSPHCNHAERMVW